MKQAGVILEWDGDQLWSRGQRVYGSASPELSRQASESLAGRVELIEMHGFDQSEVGEDSLDPLWMRGGFPRSFLSKQAEDSMVWRKNFIATFLERDLSNLGFGMSPVAMERFWTMLSHYHGQIWNGNEIASSLGVAPNTAKSYLDALEQTYMVRRLQPWHANLGKRLVKSPKIYIRDSGIFHTLQGLRSRADVQTSPKLGASWEGFAWRKPSGQSKLTNCTSTPSIADPNLTSSHFAMAVELALSSNSEMLLECRSL